MSAFIKVGGSGGSGGSTTFDGLTDKATVDLPVVNTPLANALSAKEDTTNKKTDVDANKRSPSKLLLYTEASCIKPSLFKY